MRWTLIGALVIGAGCTDRERDRPRPGGAAVRLPDTLRVSVTGHDFNWRIRYPGADGQLGTVDDVQTLRDLRLPVDTRIVLELHSDDYIYTLAFPHRELKEMAIPDLTFTLEFVTRSIGRHPLLGDQMCGYAHPDLIGELIVEPRDQFLGWYREQAAGGRSQR